MEDMDWNGWTYDGDVDVRHGGFWWRQEDDQTLVVQVVPYSDEGGPDNLFRIVSGHVSLDGYGRLAEARECCGLPSEGAGTGADVAAVLAFSGFGDVDTEFVLRIGPVDEMWEGRGTFPDPDWTLRSGTSLRKWMQREWLHGEPTAAAAPRT